MEAAVVVFLVLVVGLSLAVTARVALRMVRFARSLQDPEQLGRMLSAELRDALREAGLDPNRVSVKELQASDALRERASRDLQRALRDAVQGRDPSPSPGLAPAMPALPPPIDSPGDGAGRFALLVLVVGAVAAAAFALGL